MKNNILVGIKSNLSLAQLHRRNDENEYRTLNMLPLTEFVLTGLIQLIACILIKEYFDYLIYDTVEFVTIASV
ncbi:MAG: hypothetical protein WBZ36_05925 [Candidatus Nitrosopolaris sp.]